MPSKVECRSPDSSAPSRKINELTTLTRQLSLLFSLFFAWHLHNVTLSHVEANIKHGGRRVNGGPMFPFFDLIFSFPANAHAETGREITGRAVDSGLHLFIAACRPEQRTHTDSTASKSCGKCVCLHVSTEPLQLF